MKLGGFQQANSTSDGRESLLLVVLLNLAQACGTGNDQLITEELMADLLHQLMADVLHQWPTEENESSITSCRYGIFRQPFHL